jgi:hypothetical protein
MPRVHVPVLVQLLQGAAHIDVVADVEYCCLYKTAAAASAAIAAGVGDAGGAALILAAAALFLSPSFI